MIVVNSKSSHLIEVIIRTSPSLWKKPKSKENEVNIGRDKLVKNTFDFIYSMVKCLKASTNTAS